MKHSITYKILREHRFQCQKMGISTKRIDEVIRIIEEMEKGKKMRRSTALRLMAEMIDLLPICAGIYLDIKGLDSITRQFFKEYVKE